MYMQEAVPAVSYNAKTALTYLLERVTNALDALEVCRGEDARVVGQQCRALELCKAGIEQGRGAMSPQVQAEERVSRSCIICVLDGFLHTAKAKRYKVKTVAR
jgi:hypothetical protein